MRLKIPMKFYSAYRIKSQSVIASPKMAWPSAGPRSLKSSARLNPRQSDKSSILQACAGSSPRTRAAMTGFRSILSRCADRDICPSSCIVDHTRWQRRPVTFNSIDEALADTAATYRRALWRDAKSYVEIWLEKDAISGVITPITSKFDVLLMVARGYASKTFLHAAGKYIAAIKKPCFVYHFGDFDPSGQDAARAVEKGLRQHAGMAEINFERIAVTQSQIDEWTLPSRPTKQSNSRAKK